MQRKISGAEQAHGNDLLEAGLLAIAVGLELMARAAPYEPQETGQLGRMHNSDPLTVDSHMLRVFTQRLSGFWLEVFDMETYELKPRQIWELQRALDDLVAGVAGDPDLEPEGS